jgi:S1-C subfamily serine protease
MTRTPAALACFVIACLLVPRTAAADDRPTLKEALALEEAMEQAIQRAEPAVACVLVSRSDVYQKWFGEPPHPDKPGRLGSFHPDTVNLRVSRDELAGQEGKDDAYLIWLRKHARKQDVDRLAQFPPPDERQQLELSVKQRYDLGDRTNIPEAFGSGVVIDRGGLLLTNYHVVRGATKVFVRLPAGKGSYADIHAADARSDLAVLRLLDPRVVPLSPIRFGDGGKVRKGQWVLALANPYAAGFRDGSPSASWGIVSNIRRRAPSKPGQEAPDKAREKTLHQYGTLIQTDARLNLGCSGGALINLQGEMIGLTTALAALTGVEAAGGYAVPLDDSMKRIIEVLRRGEEVEHGFLGVGTEDPPPGERGVVIRNVAPGSPAFRAGLYLHQRILKVNGQPVRESDDMFLAIGRELAGASVTIEIEGRSQPVTATLAKFYVPGPVIAANEPAPFRGLRVDHTSIWYQRLPFFLQRQGIPVGVVVREVQPDSPARAAGLKVDDVIEAVNGEPVMSPAQFYHAVRNLQGPVELTLVDSGHHRKLRLE